MKLGELSKRYIYSVYTIHAMVSRIIIEGPIVKVVTRSGHGGHVIVPEHWIGKTVRVSFVDQQASTVDQPKPKPSARK